MEMEDALGGVAGVLFGRLRSVPVSWFRSGGAGNGLVSRKS